MSAGFRDWLIEYFPAGSSTGQTIRPVTIRVTRTGKAKTNTAEVIIDLYNNSSYIVDGELTILPDEIVKIYAAQGDVDTTNSAHLLGTYVVLNHEIQSDARTVKIFLGDKTYNMLSKIWAGDESATPNTIVNTIVQTINEDGSSATPITTDIDSTKSTGAAFSSIEYFSSYKTAYEAISEISQVDLTGDDRPYLFWFDENDKFYWKYPGQTLESDEFSYGVSPVLNMKIQKAESESIAMIIYNAGNDKNGDAYLGFYLDPEAGTIKKRMKYQPMTDISKQVTKDLTDAGTYAGTSNSDFQALLKARADARSRAIVQQVGTGLWEAKVTVGGTKWDFGALYNVDAVLVGFPKTPLRLNRIVHTMDKKGWVTTLEFLEDVEATT